MLYDNVFLFLLLRPVKSPLKIQNGVQESDSPVKRVHKRSRAIIDSDDEDQPIVKEQVPKQSEVEPVKSEKVRFIELS